MKKNVVYIGIAILVGLLIGYFIFGRNSGKGPLKTHDHTEEISDQMWTCSMHPQIMQSDEGDCPICGMDLIPAEVTADGLAVDQFKMTENALALANIQTSIVGGINLDSRELKISGKIKENEETNAVQASYFEGRIEKLFVNSTGENVNKGQLLATIYSPELVAAQQELLTTLSLKKSQPELYNAVRNKLKLWKLSDNQINKIEASGKVNENFPIYATVSGTVAMKIVEAGDYVKQGQALYKIANLKTVWASFDAYENQISLLKKGQKIKIETNAYPDKSFNAVISFVDPILNTTTRTVTVRAVLENKNAFFKPGMFVDGMVSTTNNDLNNSITIPKSAVLWTGKRSVVYVKIQSEMPVFEMKEVTLGNANNDTYQILDGLENGEEIVTEGTFTVDAAAQLQGKKSMMKRSKIIGKSNNTLRNEKTVLSTNLQKKFIETLSTYFLLKDALVAGDSNNVSMFSSQMEKEWNAINTSEVQEVTLNYINKIVAALAAIAQKEEIAKQRSYFVELNENLGAMVENIDNFSDEIYIQKCPMANTNKGAIWLSKEKEIRNPYFGDKMLSCGSVIKTLKKN